MMKKIELICSLPNQNNIGGETLKNKYLYDYLKKHHMEISLTDIEKYKKWKLFCFFKLFYSIINPFSDKIIISKASKTTYAYLKFCYFFNLWHKKIYYFVIGGKLHENIEKNIYLKKYYKQINKIYVESTVMKNKMHDLGLDQTEHLPNFKSFIIKDRSRHSSKLPLKAVFFARIQEEKGTELIFEMLKKINETNKKLSVDFFGPIDNNYEKKFFKRLHEDENTQYKGILDTQKEESFEILSSYDFMLLPTYWEGEGFPGSIIDAFISSLPVIASDWNYNSEILNEETGALFKAKKISAFCEVVNEIVKNPGLLLIKRKKCFKESLKYHVDTVLERIVEELK